MQPEIPLYRADSAISQNSPLSVTRWEIGPDYYEPHWHEYATVDILTDGQGTHWINHKSFPVQKGYIHFIRPTDIHTLLTSTSLSLISLRFRESAVPPSCAALLSSRSGGASLSPDELSLFCSLADAILFFQQHPSECAPRGVQTCFELILLKLLEKLRQNEISFPLGDSLQRVVDHINSHFCEHLTLESLAELAGYSPAYFSSVFRQKIGCTYTDYLSRRRLDYACALMQTSSLTLQEIGEAAGFSSFAGFCKATHRLLGQSPGAFRRSAKRKP